MNHSLPICATCLDALNLRAADMPDGLALAWCSEQSTLVEATVREGCIVSGIAAIGVDHDVAHDILEGVEDFLGTKAPKN